MATKNDPNQDQATATPTSSNEAPSAAVKTKGTPGVKILRPPTAAELAAAQATAEKTAGQSGLQPGTVLDLPDGWKPYVLDLGIEEGRLEAQRANLQRKGYTKADGFSVVGINQPEVWVIPTHVYENVHMAARQKRDDASRKAMKVMQMPG